MKQQRAIFTEKPLLLLGAGTQWGKTRVGALRMKRMLHTFTNRRDNFLITAPTYKTLHQSTLPAFMELMEGYGTYDKKFDTFNMFNGGTVFCRTETDPDSIVGITNIRHIWGDEAGKYRLYFWENIQARAEFCGCAIDLTTSPYSMNWIPKEIIKPVERGLRSDVEYIQAASWENPYHALYNPERREAKRSTMDARRFDMVFGGQFGQMAGLVYDCFDEDQHIVRPFELPAGTKFFAGVDWGFTDPFVLLVRAITPSGHHFQVSEYYKTGLTAADMVQVAKQKRDTYGIQTFFADPSRPEHIEEFNRQGLSCLPAQNDIRHGIDLHYDLIKSGKYQIFGGTSPHTVDELAVYHYPEPEDLGPDEDSKEQLPVGQNDHTCFVAGTMIKTRRGDIPIEDVTPGDLVATPLGWSPVLNSGCTGYQDTVEAEFSNGTKLEMTKDHPVYQAFSGFKPLDSDRYGAIVAACENTSYLTAKNIDGMEGIGVPSAGVPMAESGIMLPFGNRLMDLCREVITSIIKTTTDKITTFQTLRPCRSTNTINITAEICQIKNWKGAESTFRESIIWPSLGTQAPMGLSGTENMQKKFFQIEKQNCSIARIAGKSFRQKALTPCFARIIASRLIDAKVALMTLKNIVWSAANHLSLINTVSKKPVRLVALRPSQINQKVYNLTVPGAGCFFANGILVSNCDANRYLTVMTSRPLFRHAPKAPEDRNDRSTSNHEKRIQNLKKAHRRNQGSESWS